MLHLRNVCTRGETNDKLTTKILSQSMVQNNLNKSINAVATVLQYKITSMILTLNIINKSSLISRISEAFNVNCF